MYLIHHGHLFDTGDNIFDTYMVICLIHVNDHIGMALNEFDSSHIFHPYDISSVHMVIYLIHMVVYLRHLITVDAYSYLFDTYGRIDDTHDHVCNTLTVSCHIFFKYGHILYEASFVNKH